MSPVPTPFYRGRRLRRTSALRDMVRETRVTGDDLIMPYFVSEAGGPDLVKPVGAMPGVNQLGLDALVERVGEYVGLGLTSVILFGIPAQKDATGSGAFAEDGVVQQAIRRLKDSFPDLMVIADTCLCEYTDHGHCGKLYACGGRHDVDNDATLELLARAAVAQARAGADMVAPSDMMDGRVAAIRAALDGAGYCHTPIMSYAVKYASSFYGPFREAAESAPSFGDRKTYQMDPGNVREGLVEAEADLAEGADILMVKPALPYLDVVRALSDRFDTPLAAYQVSGEYAMIKAAAERGWVDEDRVMVESLTCIKRAGATLILSYFTEAFLRSQVC